MVLCQRRPVIFKTQVAFDVLGVNIYCQYFLTIPKYTYGQLENSLIARLKYPEDNVSPKWVKSRRRRVHDSLKQTKIPFQPAPLAKIQNYLSDGGLSCPSGGPWGYQERERGCKRGLEDQMGGPAGKKMKD